MSVTTGSSALSEVESGALASVAGASSLSLARVVAEFSASVAAEAGGAGGSNGYWEDETANDPD